MERFLNVELLTYYAKCLGKFSEVVEMRGTPKLRVSVAFVGPCIWTSHLGLDPIPIEVTRIYVLEGDSFQNCLKCYGRELQRLLHHTGHTEGITLKQIKVNDKHWTLEDFDKNRKKFVSDLKTGTVAKKEFSADFLISVPDRKGLLESFLEVHVNFEYMFRTPEKLNSFSHRPGYSFFYGIFLGEGIEPCNRIKNEFDLGALETGLKTRAIELYERGDLASAFVYFLPLLEPSSGELKTLLTSEASLLQNIKYSLHIIVEALTIDEARQFHDIVMKLQQCRSKISDILEYRPLSEYIALQDNLHSLLEALPICSSQMTEINVIKMAKDIQAILQVISVSIFDDLLKSAPIFNGFLCKIFEEIREKLKTNQERSSGLFVKRWAKRLGPRYRIDSKCALGVARLQYIVDTHIDVIFQEIYQHAISGVLLSNPFLKMIDRLKIEWLR